MKKQFNISHLNPNQQQVVLHNGKSPLLVLAAAGTGKTETLTTRIAHMIKERNVSPKEILAVTFTKKAAREMAERAAKLAEVPRTDLTIGTFHSICAMMLRQHSNPFYSHFRILSESEAEKLIELCAKAIDQGGPDFKPAAAMKQINDWRNEGFNPEDIPEHTIEDNAELVELYKTYRHACHTQHLCDFDDLLLNTVTLMRKDKEFRTMWTDHWRHVLVDEFQDTNVVQLQFLKHLTRAPTNESFMAVGDDAQAIHEWRGARVENILTFAKHFRNAETMKLELNYRSVGTVLKAANNLIEHNQFTTDKRLICTKAAGDAIKVHEFQDESAEANGIAKLILQMIEQNEHQQRSYRDVAVLYRINAMSLSLEKAMRDAHIPYTLKGAMSFFERAEIKTIMAYLRLAANPTHAQSDEDFKRAVTTPARGFGAASMKHLQELATQDEITLIEAAHRHHRQFKGKVREALRQFLGVFRITLPVPKQDQLFPLEAFNSLPSPKHLPYTQPGNVADMMERIIDATDYVNYLLQHEDLERWENIQELITTTQSTVDPKTTTTLTAYLQQLEHDYDSYDQSNDKIQTDEDSSVNSNSNSTQKTPDKITLMTLHASKGLEFPIVFMTSVNENTLPHYLAVRDKKIDEERRLAYVGITRAKEQLVMTYILQKQTQRGVIPQKPSRFIDEMKSKVEFTSHCKRKSKK